MAILVARVTILPGNLLIRQVVYKAHFRRVANRQKHRIFVGQDLSVGLEIVLGTQQTHYISRVLRLRDSDILLCFDGSGTSFIAGIVDSQTKNLRLSIESEYDFQTESQACIHLVHALTKRPKKVLQKATELGVSDIWPITSQRSEVRLNPQRLEQKLYHWKAIILSACEQSGRNRIPRLHAVGTFSGIMQSPPCETVYLFHPGSPAFKPAARPEDICLIIGPEGGWAEEELEIALEAGVIAAGFGKNVLRADTAPVAALSILQSTWNWQCA